MDEKKLGELFKDAVRDTPPATFGTGEVRQASARAATRHRQNVVLGSVLAVVLLGGGGITAVALSGGTSPTNASGSALSGSADTANSGTMKGEAGAAAPRVEDPPTALNDQTGPSKQGGATSGGAGSASTRTPSGGCEKADGQLAAALASELPSAPNPRTPIKVPFGCPPSSRGAAFKVTDGARSGTVSLVVIPPGVSAGFAPLGIEVPGTQDFSATGATSGATVYLVSQPTPELSEAPFNENGSQIVARIAQKF